MWVLSPLPLTFVAFYRYLLWRFTTNFCGDLSLTFVVFCFKFLRCLVDFIKASKMGCLVVCLGAT